jgi:hypothetical protein
MSQQDDRQTVSTEQMGQYSGGGSGGGSHPPTQRMGEGGMDFRQTVADSGGEQFANQMPNAQETQVLRVKGHPLAWLIRREGPRAGQMFRLQAGETMIGRDAQSDIILDDEAVSRWHGKVKHEDVEENSKERAFFLYDMASENGTWVNGTRIYRQMLKDGDEVTIGQTVLVFKKL